MTDQPNPNDPDLMYDHTSRPEPELYDIGKEVEIEHRFEKIIGNELHCITHDKCTTIRIKPTEVLEKGADGQLHLVDKAP